jgi:hypothetical protein
MRPLHNLCLVFAVSVSAIGPTGCGQREPTSGGASAPGALAVPGAPRPTSDPDTTLQKLEAVALEPTCSVENIVDLSNERPFPVANAVYAVARDKVVKFIGFATVKSKGEPLGSFTAVLAGVGGAYRISGQTNLDRPDVASFFKAPGMLKSGFHINADLREVPSGDYRIFLQGPGGVTCTTHHTLRIQ